MSGPVQPNLFGEVDSGNPAGVGLFADIVFDRPLDHPYSYAVPERLRGTMEVGKRVMVPFGKGDRATVGFCVNLHDTDPGRAVKEISRVLDDDALLSPDLLRLTRWMADYYLCGWGQVLNAVVPAGAKEHAGTRSATFLEVLPEDQLPTPLPPLTAKQNAALDVLRRSGKPIELKKLARLAQCGSGPIEALLEKKVARRVLRRLEQFTPALEEPLPAQEPIQLNADQVRAWQSLEQAVRQGGFKALLLHGVTGSGKTELYLKAIDEVVRQGKQALVLVPEISLTPQTIQAFRGRGGDVAVLHSHMTNAERGAHWRKIAAGQVQVIVGARSAIFAPARRLGLIVIDEEHEGSFKQDATPRYHARDVAVMRARLENLPVVLGSATPSLESWYNAQRGQYTLLTLPNRVLDRPLPQVALVDLRQEILGRGAFHALSRQLENSMRAALSEGGQVILLLNRRGFSTHLQCPGCGHVEFCRFCDLALTYHRDRHLALCHHCGFEAKPPEICPQCGQATVRYYGLGTEKLQVEIEEKFPGFVVRRMDSDTMKRPGSHGRVLAAFRRGEIHILMGTQMIAKGLDFPNVTLVGVVNADVGLHLPDFRSAERTFQLLAQVAGRTGRGPRGGRVLVQTFNPEQPCIALAARHDYGAFVQAEMTHRKAHNYPPYQRLARLIVRSKDRDAAAKFAERLSGAFNTALTKAPARGGTEGNHAVVDGDFRLLGAAEAPVFRLKGYFRYHFQLQSSSPGTLHRLLRQVLPAVRTPTGVDMNLDIDPQQML